MGFDYVLVHLKFTIPPAIFLTLVGRPLLSRLDAHRVFILICIAVVSTIPWDSYLIHRGVWTYPRDAVTGLTLFSIPLEEVFFFVIQTYSTSLLYLLLSKLTFPPALLLDPSQLWEDDRDIQRHNRPKSHDLRRLFGQIAILLLVIAGVFMIQQDGRATYLGLILTWAGSFILFLWTVTYPLLSRLPIHIVALSIGVPTLYLWAIDTWALKRGTWVIADRTKLCIYLWDGLEIEEALFFLASNCLVVLGQIACEYTLAILHAFPSNFPNVPAIPSFVDLLRALALDPASFDFDRVRGLAVAVQRLRQKSRSFYLASATFEGRLRVDLIMLYSFCRVADDLIDYATTSEEVISNLSKLAAFLDIAFEDKQDANRYDRLEYYVRGNFPPFAHDALILLPFEHLSRRPLDELLRGFKTDSRFRHSDNHQQSAEWPISDESDLDTYAFRVAGTVAGLCLELVFANTSTTVSFQTRQRLLYAGGRMGMALQCVNIARDIETDARLERVYIPTSWLEREGLTPNDVMEKPGGERVEKLRDKLLAKADGLYREARPAIEDLPPEARASMRVAIESYMEIGRVLRKNGYRTKHGRASVPLLRRLWVAWRALNRA